MNLGPHVAVSAAAGAVLWAATGDARTLPVAIGAGVLPDADHLLDYYNWYVRRSYSRLILLLHGWEYLVAAVLIYFFAFRENWMLAVVIGYATQIGADQLFNGVRWHTYSLIARAAQGFRASEVHRDDVRNSYTSIVASVPVFKEPLRRWFERRIQAP